ncbi:MAG: zf-HC2 domain-containing protein [Gemmatimonadaceae bacterium]|nr:zf-HC2 domain-containing protein [Gemmatimonadaceae bacterium]
MTDCNDASLRDALPDLIHGRLSQLDRATISAHIEGCDACRAELALLGDVRQMVALTPAPDVARIVAALPSPRGVPAGVPQVASESAGTRPLALQPRAIWRLAGVAVIVAVAGMSLLVRGERSAVAPIERVARVEQVQPVAASAGPAEPVADAPVTSALTLPSSRSEAPAITLVGPVDELSDDNLETLLAELDGMEGLPAVEPEPLTIDVDDLEGIE